MDPKPSGRLPASVRVILDSLIFWWDEWINLWIIGLVWAICWLSIVLGPPATFGMAYVAFRLSRGESLGVRGLYEGARQYFVKSWLWMLIYAIVLLVLLLNVLFYGGVDTIWAEWLQYIMVFFMVLWIVVHFYALGFLMEHEDESLRLALRNGLFTIIAAPGYSLILTMVILILVWLTMKYYVPILIGGPAFIAVLRAIAVRNRLAAYGAYEKDNQLH